MMIYRIFSTKIMLLLGYKKYQYSNNNRTEYKWCFSDEKALRYFTHFTYVDRIEPLYKRIKPKLK